MLFRTLSDLWVLSCQWVLSAWEGWGPHPFGMDQRSKDLRLFQVPCQGLVQSIFPLSVQTLACPGDPSPTRIQMCLGVSCILIPAPPLARRFIQTKSRTAHRCLKTTPDPGVTSFLCSVIQFHPYFNFRETSLVYSYPKQLPKKIEFLDISKKVVLHNIWQI